jgi:hypothetical protein
MSVTILEAIDNLVSAVGELSAKMNSVGVAISVQGCGCSAGVAPDNDGTDGEAIPDPIGDIIYFEPDPDPPYNRKCRIAEVMWDAMDELLAKWDVWNADTYAQLGLVGFAAMIGATLGLVSLNPLVIIAGAVGGAALGIALALIGIGFDADDMIDFWTTRKSDIICELYKSTSTANARDRLQAVMDDFGALTTIEEGLINLVLSNAVLSTLFFDTDAVIAFIDGFTPTFDCDTCEPDCPNFDGVYYYPCEAKAWCEIATVGEWVAFDITNVTGVPDGLEGYFTRQALGLPDGDCLGDAGQMYLLLDFGLEITGHRLQALTRGNMTNRLPTVSWSNDPAAFGDPAHASWNNPSGNDNWYTAGASLTWSSELQSLNNPYRYVRLKMGAEAGDANGVQLFIDAVRNNPS